MTSSTTTASPAPSGANVINVGERTNVTGKGVILGLVPRTHGAAGGQRSAWARDRSNACTTATIERAEKWVLGASPRMTPRVC